MSTRTNTATWDAAHGRWRISVQREGVRKSFYSRKPGRTGQREANAKADAWLDGAQISPVTTVRTVYVQFSLPVRKRPFHRAIFVISAADGIIISSL